MNRQILRTCVLGLMLPASVFGDVVLDWNDTLLDAVRADRTPPPKAARGMAMVQIAVFDAVNAIQGGYESYLDIELNPDDGASAEAAACVAAHDVLLALYPAQAETFATLLTARLDALDASDAAIESGREIGVATAAAIVAARADDGSADTVTYTPGIEPGDWQPTPAAFADPVLPQWPFVTAFCLPDVAALRRGGPPPLDSVEYTTTFNETKSIGSKTSTTRTADQTEIAFFWADGGGTATPPGHWFQIARDISNQRGLTLIENARLFALMGMAVCDAGICAWDNKYFYGDWRPITAIRAADSDGNDDTEADAAWEPLISTPPFPSYTSGHSTFSGAGSKILSLFLESDEISFSTTSDDFPGVTRSFTRLSQAANEGGRSRIYGGIHWEYDNQDGLATGRELAIFVFDNFLKPVESDSDVITIDVDDIQQCGPISLVPLGLMFAGLMSLRRK